MRTLMLMRHAMSSHEDDSLSDHDRPLDQRGRMDANRMGRFVVERNVVPQAFVASTAVRARDTMRLVMKSANVRGEGELQAELYLAEITHFVKVLVKLPVEYGRVMLVGHCPGIEEFLAHVTGAARHLPTGAIAHVELPISAWKDFSSATRGELLNLWLPKDIS